MIVNIRIIEVKHVLSLNKYNFGPKTRRITLHSIHVATALYLAQGEGEIYYKCRASATEVREITTANRLGTSQVSEHPIKGRW